MTFALLSELHRLTPDQIAQVDHIICDDGDWSKEEIAAYIDRWRENCVIAEVMPDDWTSKHGELL
jgi:hypothetical protein